MDTKFQLWLFDNQPSDEMFWKEAFWNAYVFWRDKIIPMFNTVERSYKDYDKTVHDVDSFINIVGEHTSKGIVNPVLKISYKGCTIVMRYNYYDYEMAVISNKELILPMDGLFISQKATFFFQGFPEEYRLAERYERNKKKFMASVKDHYSLYTLLFLLKNEFDSEKQ